LYFVKGPYTKLALNQKNTNIQLFGEFNENKINEIATQSLSKKDEIISFEKIKPSLVFFNEDIQTFSIITTSKQGDPEYNQLLKLYNSQLNLKKEKKKLLINYRALTHEEFLPEVKNILNLNTLSLQKIREIIGSYCFTSDNFIKMILILLRTRAGIPIIMMGETGCGKTSLIKILSTLLNKGNMNLEIKNIHAGIKDHDIIEFIEKVNKKANENISNEKIWVFFDEINTCLSLSLLTEIFINRTYNGEKINENIRLIGACTPYRKKKISTEIFELNRGYNNEYELVYLVQPLPQSLLHFVFNFGLIDEEDERKYIYKMIEKLFSKEEIKLHEITIDSILECHKFLRKRFGPSIVSLRDISRFYKIVKFFQKYFCIKDEYLNKDIKGKEKLYKIKSIICSIYICYFIRLNDFCIKSNFEYNLIKTLLKLVNINEEYEKENEKDE
jgi:ABC-type oligopeptide transport system ATPase subunit